MRSAPESWSKYTTDRHSETVLDNLTKTETELNRQADKIDEVYKILEKDRQTDRQTDRQLKCNY